MDNPLVRTADSIFSDRINLWSRLRDIEKDTEGAEEMDASLLEEIVLKSVRMELCFSELKSFNDTGQFMGRHPFIKEKDERARVLEVLRTDPDRYFEERKNIELNGKSVRQKTWTSSRPCSRCIGRYSTDSSKEDSDV